ncbi:odorant receptor 85b isoform X2 [Solenopsis invicta]|uniref:odorant receptor 85b isoform X2 n=1 Tax=Solenopsis invicta TaxID=13686 RepID=UPI00193CB0A0|nr:odorant receptor 85b isoform X2 [Solenopsis invicta]
MSFYDNHHYYHFNKTSLCIIGQWPFQSRLRNNVMFAVAVFFISSLTVLEVTKDTCGSKRQNRWFIPDFLQFWGLIAGITDLSIIMENTSPLLVNNFIIIKLTSCWLNQYNMKDLLEQVKETWKVIHKGPENEILQYYAEATKNYSMRYATGLYAMWLFYCLPPVIITKIYTLLPTNETYSAKFLYRLEHVLDVDKYYNLLMLHAFISVFYIVSVPIAVDSMFILCTEHVGALFGCIKYNMQRIEDSELFLLNPNIAHDEAYDIIVSCIKLHKRILKFFDRLASTYAMSFLLLLANVVICSSFNMAELVMVDNQPDEIVRILASNAAQLAHIYYLSATSQRLTDYSTEFQEVIYSCKWYQISLRSRHLLRLTLLRSTKPCQIKAAFKNDHVVLHNAHVNA